MSPKECTLLIPVRTSTCVPFHTAPIQHTSRVTATTAIIGVDFADLHTHSSKKSTILHAQDTCIFIIMNGYAQYECQTHIKQQSNRLVNRFVTGGLWIEPIHLTLCHHLHQFRYCRQGRFLTDFPTDGYLLNALTQLSITNRQKRYLEGGLGCQFDVYDSLDQIVSNPNPGLSWGWWGRMKH